MCRAARGAKARKSVCDEHNEETSEQLLVPQIGLKPLMKLFRSHAVYDGKEICYRDFIHKVKIELLKEKLLNNSPPPPPPLQTQKKIICYDNEAASISFKG